MEFKKFTAGTDDNDRRIDKIVRRFLPELSLSEIYKYLRKGLIKINGKKAGQNAHVFENDELLIAEFIFSKGTEADAAGSSLPKKNAGKVSVNLRDFPDIIFKNKHILIINKPYDVNVHGSKDSLDKIVQNYYEKNVSSQSLSFKTGPLHRLDRKTTGLLAFSLSLEGARWFTKNIQTHVIQKKYYAVLQGKLQNEQEWNDSIKKIEDDSEGFHKVIASEGNDSDEDFKTAQSYVVPLKYGRCGNTDITFCEITIKTGRTHQIRSQAALHGFPLLGDTAYGGKKVEKMEYDFYLQAFSLSFPEENPLELPEKIKISPSENMKKFLKSCYIDDLGV